MFCTACGSEISLAADVCPSCGRRISVADVRPLASAQAAVSSQSGVWARSAETLVAPAPSDLALSSAQASIHAGDLDLPGFPRELAGRVALLTGLVMLADLLLPWVTINGTGYAPTRLGLPALGMVLTLVAVIAPPLIPRLRRAAVTRALPFGAGALTLGFAGALWLLTGPLAPALARSLIARINYEAAPSLLNAAPDGALSASLLQVAPALGLYLFMLGAGTLVVAGYQTLTARHDS